MSENVLEIKNLQVNFDVYGGSLKVLNGINLSMEEGEKVGLVGETDVVWIDERCHRKERLVPLPSDEFNTGRRQLVA